MYKIAMLFISSESNCSNTRGLSTCAFSILSLAHPLNFMNLKHHNCSIDNCLALDNDSSQRQLAGYHYIHCLRLCVCQFLISGPPKVLTGPSTKARIINAVAYKAAPDARWIIRACATYIPASIVCAGGGRKADATLSSWSIEFEDVYGEAGAIKNEVGFGRD